MKERLINNSGLKILSIFLAFFLWLLVVNVSNPEVSRSQEVPLEIVNGEVLKNAGRTYEISGKSTVTVGYDVHTLDDYKIRSSDFRAYIDLSELYDVTGSVQVKVEVLNNKQLVRNAAAKPGVVRVMTEELQVKRFVLAARPTGEPADEYVVNEITLTPEQVTVEGPVSQVGMISSVGAEVNVEGLSESTEGITAPVFYDANGNKLEDLSDQVTVNTSEIHYQATINKVKTVPIDFAVTGTVASGYRYTGVECSVKSIAVSGLKSNLASLNMISISGSELNVDGASADKVVNVDIRDYLPDGVTIASTEDPILEIHLKVEPLTTLTMRISSSEITLNNRDEELDYKIVPARVEVTLRGLKDDLDSLNVADLNPTADVSGLQPGVHEVAVVFDDSDVFTVADQPRVQIEVSADSESAGESSSQESHSQESHSQGESAGQSAAETSAENQTSAAEHPSSES